MEGIKKQMAELKKLMREMSKHHMKALDKIKETEPELVGKVLKDNKKILKAIDERDVETLMKIQKDYADYSNK